MIDIWNQPGSRDCTHYPYKHRVYTHVDMIWVSHKITADISASRIEYCVISDHAPIMIIWRCSWLVATQLIWGLNNFLLESAGVADTILSAIPVFFS